MRDLNDLLSYSKVFDSGYTEFLGISLWVYGVVCFPFVFVTAIPLVRQRGGLGTIMIPLRRHVLLRVRNRFSL